MEVLKGLTTEEIVSKCARPNISEEQMEPLIKEVYSEVMLKGDEALRKYTRFFDKVDLESFVYDMSRLEDVENEVSDDLKDAIKQAMTNIRTFHAAQRNPKVVIETMEGVRCWQESRAIDTVGIYIPGGSAPLFSTVLMLACPAKLAGCKRVVLCTPPNTQGEINPAILFAAKLTGVDEIYTIGGAQAIAAMALGTETIPKVDKIFGPGNQFVTAAKTKAQQFGVAIDMPAGPSELLVYADDSSNAAFVASDLLSQAEHGKDSQVIAVTTSQEQVDAIRSQIDDQLSRLPRKEIAEKALEQSKFVVVSDRDQAIDVINQYAPEHLILCVQNTEELVEKIENAGSVFLGNYTPESAGDYASGTNHTLPTSGYARSYSGVNLDAFQKKITFQEITEKGMLNLGPTIELMAEAEQLEAHKNAVTLRLKALKNEN